MQRPLHLHAMHQLGLSLAETIRPYSYRIFGNRPSKHAVGEFPSQHNQQDISVLRQNNSYSDYIDMCSNQRSICRGVGGV